MRRWTITSLFEREAHQPVCSPNHSEAPANRHLRSVNSMGEHQHARDFRARHETSSILGQIDTFQPPRPLKEKNRQTVFGEGLNTFPSKPLRHRLIQGVFSPRRLLPTVRFPAMSAGCASASTGLSLSPPMPPRPRPDPILCGLDPRIIARFIRSGGTTACVTGSHY